MNVMNNSSGDEEQAECPLCMEPLEVDDLNFYPCTCGYQICRFCWHRIRTDENELCPACRKAYPENPADFTPLSQEQIAAFKAEKRQRDQQRKAKISENRKHLANVRVVQKNLVFVVGLPPRLADPEILKKHEYFGKYGKIHKVVINPSTTYAGGPSASAYVTYINNNDALKAIQSVNNIMIDGRLIKTSLGTTKYCSHFMKNQSCPKPDCMYLHELGDQEASFTKEEMHQGKHQEYEKRLHDTMQAQLGLTPSSGGTGTSNGTTAPLAASNGSASGGVGNGNVSGGGGGTGTTTNGIIANGTAGGGGSGKTGDSKHISDITNGPIQCKEAWPSLSTSPIDGSTHGGGGSNKENKINGGSNKENGSTRKHEKSRSKGGRKHRNNGRDGADRGGDRLGKDGGGKHNSNRQGKDSTIAGASAAGSRTTSSGSASSVAATVPSSLVNGKTSVAAIVAGASAATNAASAAAAVAGTEPALTNGDAEKEVPSKKALLINGLNGNGVKSVHLNDLLDDDDDDELDFEDLDNDALSSDNDGKTDTPSLSSSGSSHAGGDSGSTLSETPSGKSSPSAFPDPMTGAGAVNNVITTGSTTTAPTTSTSSSISPPSTEEVPPADSTATVAAMTNVPSSSSPAITNGISSSSSSILSSLASDDKQQASSEHVIPSSASLFGHDGSIMTTTTATMSTGSKQQQPLNGMAKINSVLDNATSRFSKLGFFDDNSSFFSHSTFDPYSFTAAAANKLDQAPSTNLDGIQSSGLTSSQLPDLLSGTNDTNEQHTKEILKNLGNLQQQQQQQPQQKY
uniref:CCR4-NOT transcription complex subunit 4 n=1 Tax=Culex pipiens TaxID=7175 RepID=A0A8D8MY94_CULPI